MFHWQKSPSTGTAQQRLFLVLKVVLHAIVVILEVLCLNTKSRYSRCYRAHLYIAPQKSVSRIVYDGLACVSFFLVMQLLNSNCSFAPPSGRPLHGSFPLHLTGLLPSGYRYGGPAVTHR